MTSRGAGNPGNSLGRREPTGTRVGGHNGGRDGGRGGRGQRTLRARRRG